MPNRIGDFLVRKDMQFPWSESPIEQRYHRSEIAVKVARAHPVICDQAAEQYLARERWDVSPGIVLPWESAWLEWVCPPGRPPFTDGGNPPVSAGWHLVTEQEIDSGYRLTYGDLFLRHGHGKPYGPLSKVEMATDADGGFIGGSVYRDLWGDGWANPVPDSPVADLDRMWQIKVADFRNRDDVLSSLARATEALWATCLFVIALLNCKNVTTRELPLGKKRLAEVEKNQRLRFSTIETRQQSGNRYGTESDPRQPPAVHICRGHFKDYRESGIFGKNHGVYWWQPHARGNRDRGVVVSTHVV